MIRVDTSLGSAQFTTKPSIEQWSHVCLIIDDFMTTLYFNGDKQTSKSSKVDPKTFLEFSTLVVGADGFLSLPYLGLIADLKVYRRSLKEEEVLDMKNGKYSAEDFVPIKFNNDLLSSNNTHNLDGNSEEYGDTIDSFSYFLRNRKSSIKFYSLPLNDILKYETSEYQYIYFEKKVHQMEAKDVCKRFGGRLPESDSKSGSSILQWISNYKMKVSTFWFDKTVGNPKCKIGVIYDGVKDAVFNCSSMNKILCEISTDKVFKIMIENEEGVFKLYISYESKKLSFDSYGEYKMEVIGNRAYLENFLTNKKLYLDFYYKTDLIGQITWKECKTDHSVIVSISVCNDDEFTCNNGDCIDLQKACNWITDCKDLSDEDNCSPLIPPDVTYHRVFSDRYVTKKNTKIKALLTLERIAGINLSDDQIDLVLTMQCSWFDNRLLFKFLQPNATTDLSKKLIENIWVPDIKIEGVTYINSRSFSIRENPDDFYAEPVSNGYISNYRSQEGNNYIYLTSVFFKRKA